MTRILFGAVVAAICLAAPALAGQAAPSPADQSFAAGHFQSALALYRRMAGQNSKDVRVLTRIGELELFENRRDLAKRDFTAALALDPGAAAAKSGLSDIAERDLPAAQFEIRGALRSAVSPFVATDPLPVVTVWLNGRRKANFLIDTGAPGIVLDPSLAKSLGLGIQPAGRGVFAGGRAATVMRSTLEEMSIGQARARHLPVVVLPMDGAPAPPGVHVDGIIGTEFFFHFLTTLDYVHGRLILADRSASGRFETIAGRRGDTRVRMWYVPDHFLFARARVNGAPGLFNIDTGGDGIGVQVAKSFLAEAHIRLDESRKTSMAGPGGDVVAYPFEATLAVGGAVQERTPGVCTPQGEPYRIFPFAVAGSISHMFFRSRIVTFDFVAMRMVISAPASKRVRADPDRISPPPA